MEIELYKYYCQNLTVCCLKRVGFDGIISFITNAWDDIRLRGKRKYRTTGNIIYSSVLGNEVNWLKTKLRNIIVNEDPYVFWYFSGHEFNLYLSPKNNKNIKLMISFKFDPPPKNKYMFSAFYKITANYCTARTTMYIAEPQFIASLISYLLLNRAEVFERGKVNTLDSINLLNAMGYSEIEPVWIKEW